VNRHSAVRYAVAVAAASLLLAGCGSAAGSTGSAGSGRKTIGVSFDLLNAIRQAEKTAIQNAASTAGYDVVFDVADQDAQKQAAQIQDLIQTRKVSAVIAIAQDGQQIAVSMTISPVRDENGKIVGTSAIAHPTIPAIGKFRI